MTLYGGNWPGFFFLSALGLATAVPGWSFCSLESMNQSLSKNCKPTYTTQFRARKSINFLPDRCDCQAKRLCLMLQKHEVAMKFNLLRGRGRRRWPVEGALPREPQPMGN